MESLVNLKSEIIKKLQTEIEAKILRLNQSIIAATESRDNETKSSVGDKYETGRAMVQMELEKNQAQLAKTEALKSSLTKITLDKPSEQVGFGSLVQSTQGIYFIAIPFGKVDVNEQSIFCISMASPIGQVLAGKSTGATVNFQGRKIEIIGIT